MTDIVKRLSGPHEWGYRDPAEGMFIRDNTPFEAADEISRLRDALRKVEDDLNKTRDVMIDDRSFYDGLVDFAGDVERAASIARAALEGSNDE